VEHTEDLDDPPAEVVTLKDPPIADAEAPCVEATFQPLHIASFSLRVPFDGLEDTVTRCFIEPL